MGKTISITPNSGINDGEPNIKLQGNDAFFAVNMNIASGLPPSGSASGVSSVLFEGSQGTLFSIEDNLSSGSIFSVSDVTGLPLIEANASGDVKLAEYGQEVISYKPILISGGAPMTTTDKLYNDNGTLKFSGNTILAGAAQTAITSILATDLKIGEDDQTKIDFEDNNAINFYADNHKLIALTDANDGDAVLTVPTADKNFTIKGTDDSSAITALDIDMADAGKATFNGDVNLGGELQTANIGYTDGDNSMTIADGGKVTFAAGFAVGSDAEGDILYHNGTSYVRLAKGSDDHILKMNGNVPNWEAESGGGGMTNFILEDDSGDEVSISDGEEVKFIGDGITINWTDTSDGSDGDPFDLTFTVDTVPVSKGGTNATSLADKAVLITQDSGTDTVAAAVMDANGELLIGGTSGPAVATLTQGSNMTITNGNGSITLASSGGAGVSDEDLKENVEDLDIVALDKVDELRPVEFDWNQAAYDEFNEISGHDIGLIAQEVEQVFPEFISEFRGRKTVDYPKLTVILLKAVQELRQEVENLKSNPN